MLSVYLYFLSYFRNSLNFSLAHSLSLYVCVQMYIHKTEPPGANEKLCIDIVANRQFWELLVPGLEGGGGKIV